MEETLKGLLQHRVPQQNVAAEVPVVIVGSTAVVGLPDLSAPPICMREGGGMIPSPRRSPAPGERLGQRSLQLLGCDKAYLRARAGSAVSRGVTEAEWSGSPTWP